jgi:hypothetical protein
MEPLEWIALIEAAIGVGSYLWDSFSGDEYTNPYTKEALKRLNAMSKSGYGEDILSKMKQNINQQSGAEAEALRTNLSQQLGRSNTPFAPKTAALEGLMSDLAGKRAQAISGVDIANEQTKIDATRSLLGAPVQKETGLSELSGSALSQALNLFALSQTNQGGSTDLNTQKVLKNYGSPYYTSYQNMYGNNGMYWTQFNRPKVQ